MWTHPLNFSIKKHVKNILKKSVVHFNFPFSHVLSFLKSVIVAENTVKELLKRGLSLGVYL